MSRATMTTEQLAILRKYALDCGRKLARKVFAKRGNHSEAHLREVELMAVCTVAFELGFEAGLQTGREIGS